MEDLIKLVLIIAGIVCVAIAISHHIIWLLIVGIILLALGGVWFFFFDFGGDSSLDSFD